MAAAKTVRALLDYGIDRFEAAGLSYGHGTANALDEAAWLILHGLGLPPVNLQAHLDTQLTPEQYKSIKALLDRRVRTRKPAAYLINEAWLGPHRFYVDERVIVPRSYIGELLNRKKNGVRDSFRAETVPDTVFHPRPARILDLCTGSGCLAIVAALAFPEAHVDAADLSADALEVAKRNVADYKLVDRVELVQSDLFGALAGRSYDLIISNPPYVKASSMAKLPDEYLKEPRMALASGRDGLEHTRVILGEARKHLARGGRLVVEIGHNRAALQKAYPKLAFEWPRTSGGKGYVFALGRAALD